MTPSAKNQVQPTQTTASPPTSSISNNRWTAAGVCLFLATIVWAAFGQTLQHDFVNFDDDAYVYANPNVAHGLTLGGIHWAFTHFHSFNWHPLTWISHMLDCEFYGMEPEGHHFTNVLLHAIAAILLFLVLKNMTGFLWRSAFVAAVFAIHPLRVESVAWVAERKDVLSGVFFILTVGAYINYARRPRSPARYGLVALLFAMGLLCKPMLVTLPVVLLLLDYWPLNRFPTNTDAQPTFRFAGCVVPKFLILEKLPLLALSFASSVVTFFAQAKAIGSLQQISPPLRIINAMISYATYLENMLWPSKLAVLYPFPTHGEPLWEMIGAAALLFSISAAAFLMRKTRPYLLTGWLWYLIMLLPAIGIFQVGSQARADRYTYLPQIGVSLALAWLVADATARWRQLRWALGVCCAAILVTLIFCTRAQSTYWQNSETLWTRALDCTSDNSIAHHNLGIALLEKFHVDEAISHFEKALAIQPNYTDARGSLGAALLQRGDVELAIVQFQKALKLDPKNAGVYNNLGNALLRQSKVDEAIVQFQTAAQLNPNGLETRNNFGYALVQKGNVNEAIVQFEKALELAQATGQRDVAERLSTEIKTLRSGIQAP